MTRLTGFLCIGIFILQACGGGGGSGGTASGDASVSQPQCPGSASCSTSTGGTTPDTEGYSAVTSYPATYCADNNYPAQWEWRTDTTVEGAKPATGGTPLIRHLRNGVVIATYSKFAGGWSQANNTDAHDASVGPFRRSPYLQYLEGDVFEVYPAIYEGEDQQIYIGPMFVNDAGYNSGTYVKPKNIVIRGVTVNGYKPVIRNPGTGASNNTLGQGLIYIDQSENVTIENIDVEDSTTGGYIGKSAIYINGANNLTLRNMRVRGFRQHLQNGIFGTGNNKGTVLLENVELAGNGGNNGPEHNLYMNASTSDPAFTVRMVGSWSHDAYYGHLFKSRAQINILEGNYFQGSAATSGSQAETYLVDIPEGGKLVARNNVFVKNRSGNNSNGAAMTYAVEATSPFDNSRPWELDIQHNTFVAFARNFDDSGHAIYPFFLNASAPVAPASLSIKSNLFVGYCPSAAQIGSGYYGSSYLALNFNEIDAAFRPRNPVLVPESSITGSAGYTHKTQTKNRTTKAYGARD